MADFSEPADFSVQDSEEYVEALWRDLVREELVARKPRRQPKAAAKRAPKKSSRRRTPTGGRDA